MSDHFNPWSEKGQASFTWTWLGAVASHTSRIHLGTGTTCPILRYHPAIIAQAAATVSCFAPGRTYLCVGTGEALNEYAATGMWPGYEEREERLLEAIDTLYANSGVAKRLLLMASTTRPKKPGSLRLPPHPFPSTTPRLFLAARQWLANMVMASSQLAANSQISTSRY